MMTVMSDPTETRGAAADEVSDLKRRLEAAQAAVEELRQERDDLKIALSTTIEHGDAIEAQLCLANAQLQIEILERRTLEAHLRKVIETVARNSQDLEALVLTITEHSDLLDVQWLARYQESERDARVDGLTGLANRRQLDECLDAEWKRARRAESPLAVLMCDIDFFKQYNDLYGHQAGDECLKEVAAILNEVARRDFDVVARYGGEEFTLLLPNTDQTGALRVANLLQKALADRALVHEKSPFQGRLTISVGLAARIPGDDNALGLMAEADRFLYMAKQQGRNRIVHSE